MSRRWLVVALAAAVLAGLAHTLWLADASWGVDFFQFRAVARDAWSRNAAAGPLDVYSPEARRLLGARNQELAAREDASDRERGAAQFRQTFETYSTPFLYAFFGLFAWGDYDDDLRIYHFVSVLAFAWAVLALCAHVGLGRAESLILLLALVLWFAPFASDVRVANVAGLQLAILAGFLVVERRWPSRGARFAGGAILGLGAMLKPNLVFPVALLAFSRLVRGDPRRSLAEAAGFAAAALAAFGLGSWCLAFAGSWLEWARALQWLPEGIITVQQGNYALSGLLKEWSQQDATTHLALAASGLALLAVWLGRSRKRDERLDANVLATGCVVMLLASRLAWLHYFVLTVPSIVVLAAPGARRTLPRLGALAALVAISITPLQEIGLVTSAVPAALAVNAGALLLLGFGLRDLAATAEPSPTEAVRE